MASPNSNFNEIIVTTLKKRRKKLADNVLNHNALLRFLKDKNKVRMLDGGETIVEELEHADNGTAKWFAGYEAFNITPQEVFTAAEFDWKFAVCFVSASGAELAKNSGVERTIALFDKRIRNAEKSLMNTVSTGLYADGTGTGGKEIGGLQLLVADAVTTGVVGGIDRASFTFWRNSTSGDLSSPSATTIQGFMNTRWLTLVRGTDKPDLIVADPTFFGYFWSSLLEIQRITQADKATSGFKSLEFAGPGGSAPVIHDDAAPSNHMYMLNTDYFSLGVHKDFYFEPLEEVRPHNQWAVGVPVIFMGNLTLSNAALQGVLWT